MSCSSIPPAAATWIRCVALASIAGLGLSDSGGRRNIVFAIGVSSIEASPTQARILSAPPNLLLIVIGEGRYDLLISIFLNATSPSVGVLSSSSSCF